MKPTMNLDMERGAEAFPLPAAAGLLLFARGWQGREVPHCGRVRRLTAASGSGSRSASSGWISVVALGALRALGVAFVLCLVITARCADTKAGVVDPTGIWKWCYAVGPDSVLEAEVRLRRVGARLAGVAVGPDRKELPLEKIEFKDGRLRFEVTRLVVGKKFTTRYEGVITGDQIKGRSSAGSAASREWEAVRVPVGAGSLF